MTLDAETRAEIQRLVQHKAERMKRPALVWSDRWQGYTYSGAEWLADRARSHMPSHKTQEAQDNQERETEPGDRVRDLRR